MKLLFFDTETNSLNHDGFIQELAWAVYQDGRLIKSTSSLLKWNLHYVVDPIAFQTTGLSREFCESHGRPAKNVFAEFLYDLSECEAKAGHNIIEFDEKIIDSNIRRSMFGPPEAFHQKPSLDTMLDLPLKNTRQNMTLKYLALDHGHVMSSAHQALADVFACAHVFYSYPIGEIVKRAMTPLVTIDGYVPYLDQPGREAFYNQKFRWNREKKCFSKKIRAFYIPELQAALEGRELFIDGQLVNVDQSQLIKADPDPQLELPF